MPNEIIVIINGREEKIPQSRNEYLLLELLEKSYRTLNKKFSSIFAIHLLNYRKIQMPFL